MGGHVNRIIDMLPKLSAEEIQRVLKAVTSKNSMLDSIIESLSSGLILVNKSWNVLQKNKAANRLLFSVSVDESRLEQEPVWDLISEQEIADWLKGVAETHKINVTEEFTTTSTDGSVRFLSVAVLSFVHDTEISGNIIRIEDVTQQKSKDVLLRRMENMAGLTNLAAGMAHEIKNPLGAMSIHVQLIQKAIQKKRDGDGTLPDRKFLEDHLDIVNDEISKLNDLVMDFLFAVRPVNAQLTLSNPDKILLSIADFLRPEFDKSKVQLEVQLEETQRLLIDEKLLRQVVINIAQNAFAAVKVKFPECSEDSDSEEMPGIISFASEIKQDKYILTIADNGCGMDDETVQRIFEPYFTTKANGTGLGMTMAYKIIKEFNGDIQVKSQKDKGSIFKISLPVPQTETKLLR